MRPLFIQFLLIIVGISVANAEFTTIWEIGTSNNSTDELGVETYQSEAYPGSPTVVDDHLYQAGTYPAPIGVVAVDEPVSNFERALTTSDDSVSLHFNLPDGYLKATTRLRISLRMIWGGTDEPTEDYHILAFDLNGHRIYTTPAYGEYVDFSTETVASVGTGAGEEMLLTITRIDGTDNSWTAFDYVLIEADPTAEEDSDSDDLPRYYEEDNLLSDNNPNDAGDDPDLDGLTTFEEFQLGTDPRKNDTDDDGLLDGLEAANLADPLNDDTDGDGIKDGAEVAGTPATLPNLADSDLDGASDSLELETGFNPRDNSSKPPASGGIIGFNFVSVYNGEDGALLPDETAGLIPQSNWNSTDPLIQWGVAASDPMRPLAITDIAQPIEDTVVDNQGNATAVTFSGGFDRANSTYNNLNPKVRLFNSFLDSRDGDPASLQVGNIPYSNWDVYVYVASVYLGPTVRVTANGSNVDVRPTARQPVDGYEEVRPTASPNSPYANVVRFSGLTGSSLTVDVDRIDSHGGIAAIQIVDATADTDGDNIPDWYELRYRTDASTANASANNDSDTLTNLAEFQLGTDPNSGDTDGDGLLDHVETGTGVYVSASNTGSNALSVDTDGDGLSDGREVSGGSFVTSPVDADSDNDGKTDKVETTLGSNPNSNAASGLPLPAVSTNQVLYEVNDVHVIWDHDVWSGLESGNDSRLFLNWGVVNTAAADYAAFSVGLQVREGALTYLFFSNASGGFAHPSNGTGDIWLSDWSGDVDLSSQLGFSGYGSHDFSDPLTLRLTANRDGAGNTWDLIWEVVNQRTNLTVATETVENAPAHSSLLDSTYGWRAQYSGEDNTSEFSNANGVRVFQSPTPLEDLPHYAAYKDSDDDGMPDVWELQYNLLVNTKDGTANGDSDTLTNIEEYLIGTSPLLSDTDGDGEFDHAEVSAITNPALSDKPLSSSQLYALGGDLDQNGFSDAWESTWNISGINADDDLDFDGVSNQKEEEFGTNPYDRDSSPFLSITPLVGGDVQLKYSNFATKDERLMASADLIDYTDTAVTPTDDAGNWSVTLTPEVDQLYYQIGALDIDADSDGLSLFEENWLGSSDNSANSMAASVPVDTDSDGVEDSTLPGDRLAYLQQLIDDGKIEGRGSLFDPGAEEASRFLVQASFGPNLKSIDEVRELGIEGWIDDQIANKTPTWHRDFIDEVDSDFYGPRTKLHLYAYDEMNDHYHDNVIMSSFGRAAVKGEDQLRQRVAFALSQIFVVSRRDANLSGKPRGLADFYDLFVEHAFGNYGELLSKVTFHPAMGAYLSHVGNQPPAPEINRYPDENYAREVMQLFSIGLWQLNTDGSRQLSGGNPIPTYSNAEITEMARVLTGFWYGQNEWGSGGWQDGDFTVPMELHADFHDFESKTLLDGLRIPKRTPSRENAEKDVADAMRMLFEHPNTPVFISQQLIQFLITDNPSPAYIQRVQSVFVDNGEGERGDLGAVVKAILTDAESRPDTGSAVGRLREPVIRNMHLARALNLQNHEELVWWDWGEFSDESFQVPLYSPSVFNFYRPDYQPPGVLADIGSVGPVFEITNSYSAISFPNRLWSVAAFGFTYYGNYDYPPDYGEALIWADDPAGLVQYANLVMCQGLMTASTKSIIQTSIEAVPAYDKSGRVRVALYLALMSPEGSVQR